MSSAKFNIEDFGPNAGYVAELLSLYESGSPLVNSEWLKIFGAEVPGNGQSSVIQKEVLFAQIQILQMIAGFRKFGHLTAEINPLKCGMKTPKPPPELLWESYDFEGQSAEKTYFCHGLLKEVDATPRRIFEALSRIYCGSIGFEFEHIHNIEIRKWFTDKIEKDFQYRKPPGRQERLIFLDRLIEAEKLDQLFHSRFIGAKRFSIRGAESFCVILQSLLFGCSAHGVSDITLAMAHRGRINIMVSFAGKPLSRLCAEFEDRTDSSRQGGGDVKYHLGSTEVHDIDGKKVRFTIPPNPSHLGFVNPLAAGMVRARQENLSENHKNSALFVSVHGDASFSGQGIVFETLNFSQLKGYSCRGSINVIINNQIGFTTDPTDYRSTNYSSDIAKGFDLPILHVNSDDAEAVAWAMALAVEFRQIFARDIVIDLICSRKYGHNEADDPSFTQPLLYKELADRDNSSEIYAKQLIGQGVLSEAEFAEMNLKCTAKIKAQVELPDTTPARTFDFSLNYKKDTAVKVETLEKISRFILPDDTADFQVHPKVRLILQKRQKSLEQSKGIDWGLGEALAYGSLMLDGISIRLSGQDSGRGTFSHRHLELHNYVNFSRKFPLNDLAHAENIKTRFEVFNSPLSEASVMGFDYGYALEKPDTLVLWEAQFGDFANNAQVIIDQFLVSAEEKWHQHCGLVLLLPHGFEAQGPEHSSARLERFLQLCANNNICVSYPTSAAQYFHLIRRQALSKPHRPLIIMTPKSLLRLPEAGSSLEDFTQGNFQQIIVSPGSAASSNCVVACSGRILYQAKAALGEQQQIYAFEQLYPWPQEAIDQAFGSAKRVFWLQEEPKNMGAFSFIETRFREQGLEVSYFGRKSTAAVSTGSTKWHEQELHNIFSELKQAIAKS